MIVTIHCFSHHFVVIMVVVPRLTLQILFIHKKLIFNFPVLPLITLLFSLFAFKRNFFVFFNPKIYLHKNTFKTDSCFLLLRLLHSFSFVLFLTVFLFSLKLFL